MLTEMRLQNFKAWQDTGNIRLAPLTVFFGSNSSGKSSLGHFLLALKQTMLLSDHRRALHLGDDTSLIDLGTYRDCVYQHELDRHIDFSLSWNLEPRLTVQDVLDKAAEYPGNRMRLSAELGANSAEQPETQQFAYTLYDNDKETLRVRHERGKGKGKIEVDPLKLVRNMGRGWGINQPEKFYRFASKTLSRYQNAQFLNEFVLETEKMLGEIYHLGPLRTPPRRVYSWSGDTPPDVGEEGDLTVPAILAATQQERQINRGPGRHYQPFDQFIAGWLTDLGVIHEFKVVPIAKGRREYEVLVQVHKTAPWVKLTDVGFGVSQVLPALVQAFYAPPDSVLWMEQPEIHLHPNVQANLADAFISAIRAGEDSRRRNTQLIIESHSEYFLNRLQRRIAEDEIEPSEVAIYFVTQGKKGARLQELNLNIFGDIENWPKDFFGDDMEDVTQRALAAARKRRKQKNEE